VNVPTATSTAGGTRRWMMTVSIGAGALVALIALSVVSSAVERHRRASDALARLEIEVANIHAARSMGAADLTADEMKDAGARVGNLLDSIDDPAGAALFPLAPTVALRVWPLAAAIDVPAVAQAYIAYATQSPDGGTREPARLEELFAGLERSIERAREAATKQATRLALAVNIGAGLCIVLGAMSLVARLWRGDRRRRIGGADAVRLPKRVSQPILSFDAQGIIRHAEGTLESALELPKEALVGTHLKAFVHADDGAVVDRFLVQCLKDPKGVDPIAFRPKYVDGVWLTFELAGGRREGDSPGNGSRVKLVDVTARVTAEEALRKSTEVFQTLVDALPLAIIIEDSGGCVRLWNAAAERTFGWTADQALGRANPSVPVSAVEEQRNLRKRICEGQAFTGLEMQRVKSDGTTLDASITMAQLKRSDGRRGDVMEVIIDVTDRKQLEAQLRQAQKMEAVGRLAGGIAHDFNNLLTAIVGHADMLLKLPELGDAPGSDQPGNSVVRFGIDQIQRAGERAAALTQQLLAFSRAQVLQPTVLNLNRAVTDMEPMLRRLIGEDIDLAVVPAANLESIKADSTQIAQVIMNLVLNARDAMPTGGRLTLETQNVELDEVYGRKRVPVIPGPYVMLAVSDTGVGMDKETQARVFEPFFTTKEKGQGTGLGLATVYGIVRQSGGYIWVYGEPGHGTSFKVYLPSAEQRTGTEDAVARPAPPPLNGSETVLLVEDEEMVRALVQQVLTWYGYHVLVAHNGEAALKLAADYPRTIDVMLTDIVMPGMSALDLVRELQAVRPTTKILYMSGYTDHAVVRNNLLDANRAFLQKPFAPDRLAHKIRELLNEPNTAQQPVVPTRTDRGPARALRAVG